jgi:hypothetical protein
VEEKNMISKKRIFLISVTAVAIIAAIAVVPGQHRLVTTVHATDPPAIVILRCAASPMAGSAVYSVETYGAGALGGFLPGPGGECAFAISLVLGNGYVREDYGEVLALKTTGDLQISTWVFTGPPVPAGN